MPIEIVSANSASASFGFVFRRRRTSSCARRFPAINAAPWVVSALPAMPPSNRLSSRKNSDVSTPCAWNSSKRWLAPKGLLGGIAGKADTTQGAAFMAANRRAQDLARRRLKTNPKDADALFALTISIGMQADYASLIEKKQLDSLRLVREAEDHAKNLLALAPDSADAYVALGAANYIIGCLPGYKRLFLRFCWIHGDKARGMQQVQMGATGCHYLRPFAKLLLALAAL